MYLSLQFPNGLLYACLVEAYGFLKGPNDLLQLYEGKYKQVVEGFSIEQMGRRRQVQQLPIHKQRPSATVYYLQLLHNRRELEREDTHLPHRINPSRY